MSALHKCLALFFHIYIKYSKIIQKDGNAFVKVTIALSTENDIVTALHLHLKYLEWRQIFKSIEIMAPFLILSYHLTIKEKLERETISEHHHTQVLRQGFMCETLGFMGRLLQHRIPKIYHSFTYRRRGHRHPKRKIRWKKEKRLRYCLASTSNHSSPQQCHKK